MLAFAARSQNADSMAVHRLKYKIHLQKDLKADTSKVEFFPFKKSWIVSAKVDLLENEPVFKLTTSSGMKKEAQKLARLSFSYGGITYSFFAYQLVKLKENPELADHFFVPFKDATTGKTSYGAGRYLDFKTGDIQNGRLLIDFNKAYNPYCAFSDGYNCPIPPRENTLKLAVTAGEKKYRGEVVSRE